MTKILRRIHERHENGDEGFSILELMTSLAILMIGIVAILGSLVVANKASGTQRFRLNGVQVANEALEDIRSQEYSAINIMLTDTAWSGRPTPRGVDATATVALWTDPGQSGAIPILPTPVVRSNMPYNVHQNVVWVPYLDEETLKSYEKAYKHVVVVVDWTDQVGFHEIYTESDIYPGNQGPQETSAGGGGGGPLAPFPPTNVVAVVDPTITITTVGKLSWVDNADNESWYEVAYSTKTLGGYNGDCSTVASYEWVKVSPNASTDANSFLLNPLGADSDYCFKVRAVNSINQTDDTGWVISNVLQTDPAPPQCQITGPTVRSPASDSSAPINRVSVANSGRNKYDIAFLVTATGDCSSVTAVVRNAQGTNLYTSMGPVTAGIWGGYQSADWDKFNTGIVSITFYATSPTVGTQSATTAVCWYKTSNGGVTTC